MSDTYKPFETVPFSFAAKQQKVAAGFFGSLFNSGVGPLLKMQADMLGVIEPVATAWQHRRHEALVDTQGLINNLRTVSEPADILKAQQEWSAGAFRRLTDDFTDCQTAAQKVLGIATQASFLPQLVENAQSVASQAAAATRAAG